jgi:hypothetical protein
MSSTIMIHSTGKDLNLKFYTSQSVSGEPYSVLGFEVQDGHKRDVSLDLFPSFSQVQEIYNALGKYLEEVNIQKMAAEFEAKEEFPYVQLSLKCVSAIRTGFTLGKSYDIDSIDGYKKCYRVFDDDEELRLISFITNDFERIEKEV